MESGKNWGQQKHKAESVEQKGRTSPLEERENEREREREEGELGNGVWNGINKFRGRAMEVKSVEGSSGPHFPHSEQILKRRERFLESFSSPKNCFFFQKSKKPLFG